jgi:hypothetical protein
LQQGEETAESGAVGQDGFLAEPETAGEREVPWPENAEAAEELSVEQLRMLLSGIDFWKAHKPVYYQRVSKKK